MKQTIEDLEPFIQNRVYRLTRNLCQIEREAYINGYLQGRKDKAEEIFASLTDLFKEQPNE